MHASTPLGFALAKECIRVLDGLGVRVRVIRVLVHASTPLGFALAKVFMRLLDGMRVGVRVIRVLVHASTPLGFVLAKDCLHSSTSKINSATSTLVHRRSVCRHERLFLCTGAVFRVSAHFNLVEK